MIPTDSDTSTTGRIETVLAVDNDQIMLTFLTNIFDRAGLASRTASDGVAAIDILETYTPDLIFIDLVMPNIDGRSLCRIIRSRPQHRDTPIVIISAIAAEEAIDLISMGANLCVAKSAFANIFFSAQNRIAVALRLGLKRCGKRNIIKRRFKFPQYLQKLFFTPRP